MNKKIIFIGLALIIFVTACGEKSMEKKLQEQNIPQFTIDLLKICGKREQGGINLCQIQWMV